MTADSYIVFNIGQDDKRQIDESIFCSSMSLRKEYASCFYLYYNLLINNLIFFKLSVH